MRHVPLTTVAVTLALAGSAALTGAAAASDDRGLSDPREDSYYPRYGDPGVDVLHYHLDLTWKKRSRTLVGRAVLDLRATGDAPQLQLDLLDSMHVRSVRVDGDSTPFTHGHKTLRVQHPVDADARHRVVVRYVGTPHRVKAPSTRSDMHRLGMKVTGDGQLRTLQEPFGALTWYPSNDQPSDKALYDITVDAPRGMIGVANGQMTSRTHKDKRTMTTFHMSDPAASYLVTLAVGPYLHRRDRSASGVPVSLWVPRDGAKRYLRPLRHLAGDMKWLERRLGPYPFHSAGAIVVPGVSAMETQELVTFGAKEYRYRNVRETMLHEMIHQWYGDTVTPDDWSGLWLNEGMAMYLQAMWDSAHTRNTWQDWVRQFRRVNRQYRPIDGPPAAYERGRFGELCVYYCTAMMYEKLSNRVGHEEFGRLVREWPQEHVYSNADKATFVEWVEEETGRELSGFFEDWLLSPTWPPEG